MKVKLEIEPEIEEEYVEIHVRALTAETKRLVETLRKSESVLTGTDEYERTAVIRTEDIIAVHAEKKWCRLYTDKNDYACKKRLYEVEGLLGADFLRISKSVIVNMRAVKAVEPVFNGMLLIFMRNGAKEYVSRSYLAGFKAYLGL